MPITKEYLEKKISELDEQEKIHWANLNRVVGMKEECFDLLKILDGEELETVLPLVLPGEGEGE